MWQTIDYLSPLELGHLSLPAGRKKILPRFAVDRHPVVLDVVESTINDNSSIARWVLITVPGRRCAGGRRSGPLVAGTPHPERVKRGARKTKLQDRCA